MIWIEKSVGEGLTIMLIHRSILLCALLLPTFAMGQDQIGQIPPKQIIGGEDAIFGSGLI